MNLPRGILLATVRGDLEFKIQKPTRFFSVNYTWRREVNLGKKHLRGSFFALAVPPVYDNDKREINQK